MNPILDQSLVLLAIVAATGFFVARYFRRRSGKGSCGSGCCVSKERVGKKGRD